MTSRTPPVSEERTVSQAESRAHQPVRFLSAHKRASRQPGLPDRQRLRPPLLLSHTPWGGHRATCAAPTLYHGACCPPPGLCVNSIVLRTLPRLRVTLGDGSTLLWGAHGRDSVPEKGAQLSRGSTSRGSSHTEAKVPTRSLNFLLRSPLAEGGDSGCVGTEGLTRSATATS